MFSKFITYQVREYNDVLNSWAKKHMLGLFLFNTTIVVLVLLNTAQYFKPFIYLGINLVFFISLLLSITFLGAKSRAMFLISLVFLAFGIFLKIVKIDIWADRASIYFYQSFMLGLMLLLSNKN